eukprot:3263806-Prymnesium_polylepis.1
MRRPSHALSYVHPPCRRRSVSKLMPTTAALAHLLSPLSFSGTFIPFLPAALHPEPSTLVNFSPTPFIIGVERQAPVALAPTLTRSQGVNPTLRQAAPLPSSSPRPHGIDPTLPSAGHSRCTLNLQRSPPLATARHRSPPLATARP